MERKIAAILVILGTMAAGGVILYYGYTAEEGPLEIHIKMGYVMIGAGILGPMIVRKVLDGLFD